MNRPTEAIDYLAASLIPGASVVTSYVRWLEAEHGQLRDQRNEALASFRSAQRSLGAIDQELGLGMDTTLAETLAEIKRLVEIEKPHGPLVDMVGAVTGECVVGCPPGTYDANCDNCGADPCPHAHPWKNPHRPCAHWTRAE